MPHWRHSLVHSFRGPVRELRAADFAAGTLRIRTPGRYRLVEDIEFGPQPGNKFRPTAAQLGSTHPAPTYVLGFFAAIAIEANNVDLDLGGHRIAMSPEFCLRQRFYAHIELAGAPFVSGQGPADFGNLSQPIDGVRVHNGYLGLSSHHGLHGNGPQHLILENLEISDFEVAPIAINGGRHAFISNIRVPCSSQDVHTRSTFSQGQFAHLALSMVPDLAGKSITLRRPSDGVLVTRTGAQIQQALSDAIESTIADVLQHGQQPGTSNPDALVFRSIAPAGLSDGNLYGLLWNVNGVAVHKFLSKRPDNSKVGAIDLEVRDLVFGRLVSSPTEVRGLANFGAPQSTAGGYAGVQTGPFGDVFRIDDAVSEVSPGLRLYHGDVLADAQLFLAQHSTRGSIAPALVEWASQNSADIQTFLPEQKPLEYFLVGNIDAMAHAHKGNIGLFIQGAYRASIENVHFQSLENLGQRGHPVTDPKTERYEGTCVRGIAVASSRRVKIANVHFEHVQSAHGPVCCLDLMGETSKYQIANLTNGTMEHGSSMNPVPRWPNPMPDAQMQRHDTLDHKHNHIYPNRQ